MIRENFPEEIGAKEKVDSMAVALKVVRREKEKAIRIVIMEN